MLSQASSLRPPPFPSQPACCTHRLRLALASPESAMERCQATEAWRSLMTPFFFALFVFENSCRADGNDLAVARLDQVRHAPRNAKTPGTERHCPGVASPKLLGASKGAYLVGTVPTGEGGCFHSWPIRCAMAME